MTPETIDDSVAIDYIEMVARQSLEFDAEGAAKYPNYKVREAFAKRLNESHIAFLMSRLVEDQRYETLFQSSSAMSQVPLNPGVFKALADLAGQLGGSVTLQYGGATVTRIASPDLQRQRALDQETYRVYNLVNEERKNANG